MRFTPRPLLCFHYYLIIFQTIFVICKFQFSFCFTPFCVFCLLANMTIICQITLQLWFQCYKLFHYYSTQFTLFIFPNEQRSINFVVSCIASLFNISCKVSINVCEFCMNYEAECVCRIVLSCLDPLVQYCHTNTHKCYLADVQNQPT